METVILLDTQVKTDKLPEIGKGEQIHIITAQGGSIPVELLELCSAHTFRLHYVSKPYNNVEIALVIGMILENCDTDLLFVGKNEAIAKLAGKVWTDCNGREHRLVTKASAPRGAKKTAAVKTVRAAQQPAAKATVRKPAAKSSHQASAKEFTSVAALMKEAGIHPKYQAVLLAAVENAMDPLTLEMMLRMQAATMAGCEDLDAAAVSEAAKPYFKQLKKLSTGQK